MQRNQTVRDAILYEFLCLFGYSFSLLQICFDVRFSFIGFETPRGSLPKFPCYRLFISLSILMFPYLFSFILYLFVSFYMCGENRFSFPCVNLFICSGPSFHFSLIFFSFSYSFIHDLSFFMFLYFFFKWGRARFSFPCVTQFFYLLSFIFLNFFLLHFHILLFIVFHSSSFYIFNLCWERC